jgi:hypothetical protein
VAPSFSSEADFTAKGCIDVFAGLCNIGDVTFVPADLSISSHF